MDSGVSYPGLGAAQGQCIMFLGKTIFTVPLSTQVYTWVIDQV